MLRPDELIARVAGDAGITDLDAAARALEATLVAFAQALDPVEAEALAGALPESLARAVRAAEQGTPPWSDDPFADLAERARLPRSLAIECAHVAGHRLAEELDPDVVRLLERRLPSPWRELLHRRAEEPPAPPVHHVPVVGEGHTLASGRPGSRHAVAEYGLDDAHADSVARAENPHGDEKLSSGEASGEPVATGHPRRRPIADADG